MPVAKPALTFTILCEFPFAAGVFFSFRIPNRRLVDQAPQLLTGMPGVDPVDDVTVVRQAVKRQDLRDERRDFRVIGFGERPRSPRRVGVRLLINSGAFSSTTPSTRSGGQLKKVMVTGPLQTEWWWLTEVIGLTRMAHVRRVIHVCVLSALLTAAPPQMQEPREEIDVSALGPQIGGADSRFQLARPDRYGVDS